MFCFHSTLLFLAPVDNISFLGGEGVILTTSVTFSSTIRALFQGTKLNYAVFIIWLRTVNGSCSRTRRLVACFCPDRSDFDPDRSDFDPRPVPVEFAVGNMTLGHCYFAYFSYFSQQYHSISAGNALIRVS